MSLSKRPQVDWKPEKKLQAVLDVANLPEAEMGVYCRREGIYSSDIERWRHELLLGLPFKHDSSSSQEVKRLKKEKEDLKRELMRKDRALAETTALLVLKKKAHLLFGEDEDEKST